MTSSSRIGLRYMVSADGDEGDDCGILLSVVELVDRTESGFVFRYDDGTLREIDAARVLRIEPVGTLRLYQRAEDEAAAQRILKTGFKDGDGAHVTEDYHHCVRLTDRPLDPNEGAWVGPLLTTELPERDLAQYEWTEEGGPYRVFWVPAEIVNRYGRPELVEEAG